ncbi:hypothetical protein BDR26DRAFT_940225 [Obelidium mucronatum]|nr:hypothetical protein BDR26DRAFT_940225 [Obelidium mucronatum]
MDKLTLTKEKPDSVLHSLCSVSTTIKKGSTFRVEAKSDLLSQVASFLPKIKHANDSLSHSLESGKSTLEDVDIEALKDGDQHIEMDLGLGVFDYAPEDISKIPKKDFDVINANPNGKNATEFYLPAVDVHEKDSQINAGTHLPERIRNALDA